MRSTFTAPAWVRSRSGRARIILPGLAALAAASLVAACGSAGPAPGARPGGTAATGKRGAGSAPALVSARAISGIGMVLADRSGRTLYSPRQEAHGTIRCTGGCLSFWFPVPAPSAAALHAASGIPGALGKIRRPDDGLTQLTYNGRPLYTFRLDHAPGQAHGNNFTDSFDGRSFAWQAVTTGGTSAPAPASTPAGGSYSYQSSSAGY